MNGRPAGAIQTGPEGYGPLSENDVEGSDVLVWICIQYRDARHEQHVPQAPFSALPKALFLFRGLCTSEATPCVMRTGQR